MAQKYTCLNCRVVFADLEIQRDHHKTDWHRYNLKRKVAGLPPVDFGEFREKVGLQEIQNLRNSKSDTSMFCKVCRKLFSSSKAFQNHMNSKKHRAMSLNLIRSYNESKPFSLDDFAVLANQGSKGNKDLTETESSLVSSTESDAETDSEVEEVDSDEWDEDDNVLTDSNPILQNNCLFCSHHSATMTKNLNHMTAEHSFFIPDIDYLIDLPGLLFFLGDKVSNFFCLWCDVSGKQFYSMESAQQHMRDKGHCKILHEGATLVQYCNFYNYAKSYPDNEEDVDINEDIVVPVLDGSNFELTLPSGAKIGHRDLFIYYRQHLKPGREVAVKKSKISKVMATYRALGWTETERTCAIRKAKDIDYMRKFQNKYATKLGVKANKLQKHFRPQVNF